MSRLAVVVLVLAGLVCVGGRAEAAPPCVTPLGVYDEPATWAQRLTDPTSVWPLTTGAGQTVAVIGTGVDPNNAQFAPDRVVAGAAGAGDDCDGRGTFAAGIVAARPDPGTTFTGLAPDARVIGYRYTQAASGGSADAGPNQLASAIRSAVHAGATVILVVLPTRRSSPALKSAVRDAIAGDVVVVAPAVADQAGVRSYPTSLSGVLAVGPVDEHGAAMVEEQGVTIAAPGNDVVSTSAKTGGKVGHLWNLSEPPVYACAAYVAGAVALVRAYRPKLRPAEVTDRLVATADPPPSGKRDPHLGWGVLDVRAAVTAELAGSPEPEHGPTTVVPAAAPAEPPPHQRLPGVLAVTGVLLAVLAPVSVAVVRRGRVRGWRP